MADIVEEPRQPVKLHFPIIDVAGGAAVAEILHDAAGHVANPDRMRESRVVRGRKNQVGQTQLLYIA